jgi:hypothetical protein
MKNADEARVRGLKQLEEVLITLRELAIKLREPMLVHLFEMPCVKLKRAFLPASESAAAGND